MTYKMMAADVKANGELRLPQPIRRALHLRGKGGLVGFVIEGKRILLTKATVVPEPILSDEEIASLARLSRRGAGKKSFHTKDAALRYLWSL